MIKKFITEKKARIHKSHSYRGKKLKLGTLKFCVSQLVPMGYVIRGGIPSK